jgi:DNA-binding LytR/AlgR family response regulator
MNHDNGIFKVTICDDMTDICANVRDILQHYCCQNEIPVQCRIYTSVEDMLKAYDTDRADLIFLDIEFPSQNGLQAADWIRHTIHDHLTDIVFMTGKTQYDRQLFAYQPLSFLAKPIRKDALISALCLSLQRERIGREPFFYTSSGRSCSISYDRILYFSVHNRIMEIHHSNGSVISFYGALKDYADQILSHHFFQINRSELINCDYIIQADHESVVLTDNEVLYISRGRQKTFAEIMLKERKAV